VIIVLKLEMADDSVSIQDVADIMDTVDGGAFRRRLYQRIVHQQQPGPHWESSCLLDTASFSLLQCGVPENQ
jgi:hypothetical protein